ncbi:Helix-turn-helix domain protein [Marinobacterium sp. xm-a-121]|uniref:helix-turn-helix domain-containing protein n=1 Tax=unclassified Marinobacterium TaxID=2644139 RepID=UPI001568D31F|nr:MULTISPECIES: helix-turn-helix transcriptional regulator [unclassified Marinobacterium]NRP37560.1 Helix-turn-helix domain protein [Marinobacterium sp. xm-a-121]NRP99904.1 Helix-turn-helix domain protein [Marinobacterium sp. xm-v-233]
MSLSNLKAKALANAEVKAEYDRLEDEFNLVEKLVSMRAKAGLTQEQLAVVMKTQKSNISRLEKGNTNPSWATLLKYAHACGFDLKLQTQKMH